MIPTRPRYCNSNTEKLKQLQCSVKTAILGKKEKYNSIGEVRPNYLLSFISLICNLSIMPVDGINSSYLVVQNIECHLQQLLQYCVTCVRFDAFTFTINLFLT